MKKFTSKEKIALLMAEDILDIKESISEKDYKLIFDTPIELKEIPGMNKDEIIKEADKKIVSIMEKNIRAYPDQWLIFRKFWESPVDMLVL